MSKEEEITAHVVQHTTHTVLTDLRTWTRSPAASKHLTDSVKVFEAACKLRDAIQAHLDTME